MNICKCCGKETKNEKFCSRSCAAKINNIGKRRHGVGSTPCEWCGENSCVGKYCSTKCFKDFQYYSYINRWMLGLETGSRTNGFVPSGHVRRYLKTIHKNVCSKCGWAEVNQYNGVIYLEVEHIDGDCTNNKISNLDLICPNCHTLTPTYKTLNSGNGNRKRLKYFGL